MSIYFQSDSETSTWKDSGKHESLFPRILTIVVVSAKLAPPIKSHWQHLWDIWQVEICCHSPQTECKDVNVAAVYRDSDTLGDFLAKLKCFAEKLLTGYYHGSTVSVIRLNWADSMILNWCTWCKQLMDSFISLSQGKLGARGRLK